jgi:hypothetical protein
MRVSEGLREAVRARVLPREPSEHALSAARAVARGGGASVLGVVFFGSRKTQAGPDPWSAYDFFVVTSEYASFYRSLGCAGLLRRSPRLLAALNVVLPPNQVSLRFDSPPGTASHAKCAVISLARLQRETSPRRSDHFCLGRLFQPTEVLYAADGASREAIVDAIASAHALTYAWVRPWLPPKIHVEDYCRTLLRVSLGGEIRPEPEGRAQRLWEAQRDYLREVYAVLLRDLEASGELLRAADGSLALARPATARERIAMACYFRWSLLRATCRWAKHMLTFEGWLDYIVRKASRHTGEPIVLTPRERRLPLLFLWPRLVRFLRHKDRTGRRA